MARTRRAWPALLLGTVLLAGSAAGVAYPLWWNHRSAVEGAALLRKAEIAEGLVAPRGVATPATQTRPHSQVFPSKPAPPPPPPLCHVVAAGPGHRVLPAILEVPRINLEAPVLNGTADAVLNVAVGHYEGSRWPGSPGLSILLAHDVSYFSDLGSVAAGDQVVWIDNCTRYVFEVTGTQVTSPRSPIYVPKGVPYLALVTCYPSNALFWTSQRFIVLAELVSESSLARKTPVGKPASLGFHVTAPPAVAAKGLGLLQNSLLVGQLSLRGAPGRVWAAGPDPLRVTQLAFEELAAARIAAAAHNAAWWSAITQPGVAMHPIEVADEFNVTVRVYGSHVTSIELSSPLQRVWLSLHGERLLVAYVTPPLAKSHSRS